jgi:serine/threonine protein phosphatase 1
MKTYVMSDIHGCYNTFDDMLNKIGFNKDDELILLGDYIDRGPGSIKILDRLIDLKQNNYNLICLTGNHEQMMINACNDNMPAKLWTNNGGDAVLNELNVKDVNDVPNEYIHFLTFLPYYHETNDFIFAHAGLNMSKPDPLRDKESLIWIRSWENSDKLQDYLQGKRVIHGHTPTERSKIEKRFDLFKDKHHSVLDIDNGCVFAKRDDFEFGNLCCVNLTDMELIFNKNID